MPEVLVIFVSKGFKNWDSIKRIMYNNYYRKLVKRKGKGLWDSWSQMQESICDLEILKG